MGHSGTHQKNIHSRKKHLPEQPVEDLRKCYENATRFLEMSKEVRQEDYKEEALVTTFRRMIER